MTVPDATEQPMPPSRDWISELPQMLARQEPESLYLDYKERQALVPSPTGGGINKQRRAIEVSKDVSSFLNSVGGAIVYGIREDQSPVKTGGAPIPFFDPNRDGFSPGEVTKEELENVITSNVFNRPSADLFTVIEVPVQGRVALVVDIAQSTVGVFQAKDLKYYRRWNFKAEPMVNYEIEDVRNRAAGPQLRFVVGLNEMWMKEMKIGDLENGAPIAFQLHCGLLNVGIRVAEVALIEFGLDRHVEIKGMPAQTVFGAGVRTVSWIVPQKGTSEGDMRWFHCRWTPQVLSTKYHPIFATEDPLHAFDMHLSASPGKQGRLMVLPWRLQAPNMSSKMGLVAIDHERGRIAVRELDWPLEVRRVLPS